MLSIIVAKAKNNIIGKDNALIWHLPEDLKRFKKLTTGHTIIMGRKTFESLGRVLPKRHHVILCNDAQMEIDNENVEILQDISMLDKYVKDEVEHFVIGGAMIYNLLMPHVTKMYITQINQEFEGDAFFPKVDEEKWKEIDRQKGIQDENNNLDYEYVTYKKI